MVKQSRNRNFGEGSKAPMLEEHDQAAAELENQIYEHDHTDQAFSKERQMFEHRMLEMEALLRAVVQDNNTLRARLEGLEIQNEAQNIPVAVEVEAEPPVQNHVSKSAQRHEKPPKPPVQRMPAVHSDEDSSSTHSVTSKRREGHRNRLDEADTKTQRSSVFRRLGANYQEKEPARSGSSHRVLENVMRNQKSHGAPKEGSQLQEVNEMLTRLEKLKADLAAGGSGVVVGSPFCEEIQKEVLPLNVRQPHLEHYEGTTDPDDHVANFLNTLQLHNYSDAIICKFFASSLKGVARSWFTQLPSGSIKTFGQLASCFRAHFMANRKTERDYSYLFSIKQKHGESLKDYVMRFNRAKLEVPGVESRVAAAAAVQGLLLDSPFYLSVSKLKFTTMEQFAAKADKYILQEENIAARKGTTEKKDRAEGSSQRDRRGNESSRYDDGRDSGFKKPKGRFHHYPMYKDFTALTKPVHEIFHVAERRGILPPPVPMRNGGGRKFNKDEFCDYHKQAGHSTERCYQLKNAIEDAIRRGWLKEFIDKQAACREQKPLRKRKHDDDDEEEPEIDEKRNVRDNGKAPARADRDKNCPGTIHTIVGGPAAVKHASCSSPASSSKRGKDLELCHVESKKQKVDNTITFTDEDFEGVETPHQDALVILARIAGWKVERVMIDTGSSADVLFNSCYEQIRASLSQKLKPYDHELFGFDGRPVRPRGVIKLPLQLGDGDNYITKDVDFVVVDCFSPYNVILGRNTIWMFDMSISMPRLKAKFPTPTGVGVCAGNQETARKAYLLALKGRGDRVCVVEKELESRADKAEPVEELEDIQLDDDPEHKTRIGTTLTPELRSELIIFLRENRDVFAWSPSDMPGISPDVITHQLRINKDQRPVRQKLRSMSTEKQAAIEEEVGKLLKAGFIRVEKFPTWLANVVMVKKSNGKWRMCVDYTDLNKACPKDCFPLPRIDQLVDSTSGHELLSFMDAFSGYNQIKMDPADQVHTSFITAFGTYSYNVMPFGLKNAGATFQRMVTEVFKPQIGRNMEVYVDDMIVKTKLAASHLSDLRETFDRLRFYQMKLNPQKSVFGAVSGKFLGFLVSRRGVEANPEKIRAILEMRPPSTVKDVQKLAGRVASLGRFVPKSADRCAEFFKILRSPNEFKWTDECHKAFEDLKTFLSSPPVLATPVSGEDLFLYLAVSTNAVSSVLARAEGRQHRPVYYVSHILQDAERRYTKFEKFILTVIISARRLRPYFDAHQVIVLSDLPLRSVLQSPDASGRMMKYALELSGYGVQFQPRDAQKAQFLADFLVEYSGLQEPEDKEKPVWLLHVDGSSAAGGSGAGLVLRGPSETKISYALKFGFSASNNEAEYEALIAGLKLAKDVGAERIEIFSDSMLVVQQLKGEYDAKDEGMIQYLRIVRCLVSDFLYWDITKIPRAENSEADRLSKYASIAIPNPDKVEERVFVEYLPLKTTEVKVTEVMPVETAVSEDRPESSNSTETWMTPYLDYLRNGILPQDKKEAKSLMYRAASYTLIDDKLYKRGLSFPYLRCLQVEEGNRLLQELHAGECSNHIQAQSLYIKALRLGYYWPTMRADSTYIAQTCEQCQRYARIPRQPSSFLHCMTSPWPFAQWGLDIVGPLKQSTGQKKNIIVACDYFTKWVEAEAVAEVTEKKVRGFLYNNILCRFGVPHTLVMDNGTQFNCKGIWDFCVKYGIKPSYASVAHPQSNGQVEAINKTLKESIKKRCERFGKGWVDELPGVLWGYRTTKRSSTEESPFRLAFGCEAVLPIELELGNLRIQSYDELVNDIGLRAQKDLMDELSDEVNKRKCAYQRRAERYYNKKVRPRSFLPGDLVCRKLEAARPSEARGALAPRWEEPVRVAQALGNGAYKLETLDGEAIPRTWNADNLRKFYE